VTFAPRVKDLRRLKSEISEGDWSPA
jgi:hypothetical protein